MSASCGDNCQESAFDGASRRYRRVLWIVIGINAAMFAVEAVAGTLAGSMALQADALDFAADSATYALTLWAIGKPPTVRSTAALIKAASLTAMGIYVLGATGYRVFITGVPEAFTMGGVAIAALVANLAAAALLYRYRDGDANVRSVWLCTRNDAIGNVAVLAAAIGVFGTASAWPDLAVAAIMATLFLTSSVRITRQALAERRQRRHAGVAVAP
jgi:Co/Zn/Cd efflux system component